MWATFEWHESETYENRECERSLSISITKFSLMLKGSSLLYKEKFHYDGGVHRITSESNQKGNVWTFVVFFTIPSYLMQIKREGKLNNFCPHPDINALNKNVVIYARAHCKSIVKMLTITHHHEPCLCDDDKSNSHSD